MMGKALYRDKWHQEVKMFYEDITPATPTEVVQDSRRNQADIVRDVGNLAQVHFSSNVFSFPLKTEEQPLVSTLSPSST
jgi:linoleate 10R-lipoxygenase